MRPIVARQVVLRPSLTPTIDRKLSSLSKGKRSVADILNVEKRNETGTARMRRLRNAGGIPAVLYGHGQENINLVLNGKELMSVMRHSGHIVQLQGALDESALIKDVLWDNVTQQVLHVDLNRVDATELIEIALTVDLKGPAKGITQGGVLNQIMHDVEIRCPANRIPEKLELKIFDLEVGHSMRAKEIPLPEGATLVTSPEAIIVQCTIIVVEEVEPVAPAATAGIEPEVIGKKKEDEAAEKK